MTAEPFFREAGDGPGVVCLHSNASASVQWRGLMDRLSSGYRVLAADSLGAGKSPAWPSDRLIGLADEVRFLEPVFTRAGRPFSLVGHSYGAAIALIAALSDPQRVRLLALYEPTLFSLLEQERPGQEAANGIRQAANDAARAIDANDPNAAGERFIDYWMGKGTWAALPPPRRSVIAASMVNVSGWAHALFEDATPLDAFRLLRVPVLLLVGGRSPPSSRGVARLLAGVLPNVTVVELEALGHMGPVTDPDPVNDVIANFLERH